MIKVYGSSDDLIEVEGDIVEEFNHIDGEETFLGFSDGTVLSIEYTDRGIWHINRVKKGIASYTKTEATGPDDEYSDCVVLEHSSVQSFFWVVQGKFAEAPKIKEAA